MNPNENSHCPDLALNLSCVSLVGIFVDTNGCGKSSIIAEVGGELHRANSAAKVLNELSPDPLGLQ